MTIGFIGGKFLPLHTGHLYAISLAKTYVDKLYVVLCYNKDQVYNHKLRESWLNSELHNMEGIEIISVEDTFDINGNYDWEEGAERIKQAIIGPLNGSIDYVFSSEPEYDNIFKILYPNAKHIVFDRSLIPVSGTQIRENPFKYWEYIPSEVKKHFVKKIAIIGIESCGKSTLTKYLAKIYNTNYVKEIGREYCEKYRNKLTQQHFFEIAMSHYMEQQKLLSTSNKFLFVDSEAIITQYYYDIYIGGESELINQIIDIQKFDLYIYLEPDVEWIDDGSRFKKDTRKDDNIRLKKMLDDRNIKYVPISGNYTERLKKVKKIVDELKQKRIFSVIPF